MEERIFLKSWGTGRTKTRQTPKAPSPSAVPFPATQFHPGSGSQSPRLCLVTSCFHTLCVYLYIKTQTSNYKLKRAHDSFQVHLSKQKSSVTVRWPDCSTDVPQTLTTAFPVAILSIFLGSRTSLLFGAPVCPPPSSSSLFQSPCCQGWHTILPNKQKSGRGLGKALPSVEKGWTLLNHPFSSLLLELEFDV